MDARMDRRSVSALVDLSCRVWVSREVGAHGVSLMRTPLPGAGGWESMSVIERALDRTGLPDVSVPYCMYYLRTHSAGIFEPQLSGESIGRPAIASSIIIAGGGGRTDILCCEYMAATLVA